MFALRAPAKINLTLEVLGGRSDGYHAVRSVMVPLELADERPELEDERNLALAAMRALGDPPAVRMGLRKRIPVQAGLGGGSSDAAAVLRAAMEGAFGSSRRLDWLRIARGLGSDVPFFLSGTAALVEGTGERVTPAGAIPRWPVLIVKPPVAISTAAAYAQLDRLERSQRPRSSCASLAVLEALQRADFSAVAARMQNDFHDLIASQTQEIATVIAALGKAGARNALLAGSGSCVFSLAPQSAQIDDVLRRLALPASYERFVTAFAATPQWRPASG
jgi:4-diphosphocytidyl-2-C-methyl-D-erythritol kinase